MRARELAYKLLALAAKNGDGEAYVVALDVFVDLGDVQVTSDIETGAPVFAVFPALPLVEYAERPSPFMRRRPRPKYPHKHRAK